MYKQVIIVRKDIKLGTGKIASQVAHASIGSMNKALQTNPRSVKVWEETGSKKVVLKVSDLNELRSIEKIVKRERIPNFIVVDAGLTQIRASTVIALGIGPVDEEKIDKITSSLKLL